MSAFPESRARGLSLAPDKFRDPERTAGGSVRARVELGRLETLWLNTGTRCNIECSNCYIESSPANDRKPQTAGIGACPGHRPAPPRPH